MYVKHADPVRSVIYVLWLTTLIAIHHDAKVGIKYCSDARECVSFVHQCMYVHSY